jgi:hypothetical protein
MMALLSLRLHFSKQILLDGISGQQSMTGPFCRSGLNLAAALPCSFEFVYTPALPFVLLRADTQIMLVGRVKKMHKETVYFSGSKILVR